MNWSCSTIHDHCVTNRIIDENKSEFMSKATSVVCFLVVRDVFPVLDSRAYILFSFTTEVLPYRDAAVNYLCFLGWWCVNRRENCFPRKGTAEFLHKSQ